MTVAAAVTALRRRAGITQQELAYRIGSAVSAIPKYEHDRMPDAAALLRLMLLAEEENQTQLAEIFRKALRVRLKVPAGRTIICPPARV